MLEKKGIIWRGKEGENGGWWKRLNDWWRAGQGGITVLGVLGYFTALSTYCFKKWNYPWRTPHHPSLAFSFIHAHIVQTNHYSYRCLVEGGFTFGTIFVCLYMALSLSICSNKLFFITVQIQLALCHWFCVCPQVEQGASVAKKSI